MESKTTFALNYDFIELHRTFRELSEHSSENDDVDFSRAFGAGERLGWPNLIMEHRLIILSEAGSGKTYEIRNIARTLREQGKSAFFLRLEHIPRDFEDAFEVGTYDDFEEWLASGEEGWLLLDSVDEARLRNPRDFELAILKLSKRISTAKDRTHIVITGRTEAWRPKTDLVNCTAALPYAAADTSERDQQAEEDAPDGSFQIETQTQGKKKPVFKIVVLNDLTADQIAVFAETQGITESKAFLNAVERADAWAFTSRPQDLKELTEFWIDEGRIGTRLEIMRNSIDRRLAERDQDRAHIHPLSAERARLGARLLAAVTTLVQDPTIRVPDGAENTRGIAIQSVLPDWNDKEQLTLLTRPIFDVAIYGAIRFHHRSVREYLAAEWFAELLKREVSRRTIEGLFFRNQYGLDIVAPTLRPILPWLAILDEKIRERVRKVAPEIIFEGGDPSQLPLEIRRNILRKVCEQMVDGATGRSMRDYAAIQRFANHDLTDDIRDLLRQYADNDDLTAFLLRMVWTGQLAGALPETLDVALNPTAERYARMAAFRAINAIGSDEDQERVRQNFLDDAIELKRVWLIELVEGLQPTEKTVEWLLACLEKSETKEKYSVDGLGDVLIEFINNANVELLPHLITGLNKLINLPPAIERRHCEVSEKFQWLMKPACKTVERLILARHPFSLDSNVLEVLHKFPIACVYKIDDIYDINDDFAELVPAWKNLNRTLFWYEIHRSREATDNKRGEPLTNYWQASIFEPLCQFDEEDFEYVSNEISQQKLLEDKLVALSLAIHLYRKAKRPRAWRIKLKQYVANNEVLSERLSTFLRPPAKSQDERRWKQQEAKWKRQAEARRKKEESSLADSKKYLNENLDEIRAELRNKPGAISNALHYLFQQARNKRESSSRWIEYNWKTLIPDFGEEIARIYRDGAASFWRHHDPKLRSEGAPLNETTHAVIIGLAGLEIEAIEIKEWPKNLSAAEVELACKFATFELNGFPTWLPKLFETHPKIVSDFFIKEIRSELSIEKPEADTNYILSDVSCSGQWAWDQLAPSIYDLLKKEPKNLRNLDNLLDILQGSTLPGALVKSLACRKCKTLKDLYHVARWFAVWAGIDPGAAITSMKARIEKISTPKDQTFFAMTFVTHLFGRRRGESAGVREAFKTPEHLRSLYLLMHKYIRREEDNERSGKGVYSPQLRDDAQDARNHLFNLLNQISGKESFLALMDIAKVHPEETSRPWMMHHAKTKAEQDGDIERWSPSQVRDFHDKLECTPSNHTELAELAVFRLLDLKDDLEHGDSSTAKILRTVTIETDMRNYIGGVLRDKAFGRYIIPQEEELADAKRLDLRFHGMNFDGPVPVELKLAGKWSGPHLFERLENQLCADYLRDNRSNRGIFLLFFQGKVDERSNWVMPGSNSRVDFEGLTVALQDHWLQISPGFPKVDKITVIGIDLTKRSS